MTAPPLLDLRPHEGGELLRRAVGGHAAHLGEALLRLGHVEQRLDLGVQGAHGALRHAGGVEHAEPGADVVVRQLRHGLAQRRQVGELRAAIGAGHRQRLHPAGADLFDAGRQVVEHELDVARQELDRGWPGATEGHVDELGAGELGEPHRREVRRLADAVIAAGELARIGAQMGDQFRDRVRRHRRVQHQHVRPADHVRDRQQTLGTVLQVAEQGIGDRLWADVAQQDGVAVRPGAHHLHGADGAAAARLVLHHRVLVPARLQVRCEQPRHDVGGSAGRSGNDDADGLARTPATLGTSRSGVRRRADHADEQTTRNACHWSFSRTSNVLSPLNGCSAAGASEAANHRRAQAGGKGPAADCVLVARRGLSAAPADAGQLVSIPEAAALGRAPHLDEMSRWTFRRTKKWGKVLNTGPRAINILPRARGASLRKTR
jgi:hypothetical protein